ncbi:hypothetical protein DVA67_031190 [Solirubrobacter sp. CPCC 204708]|uniref:Uncharacterized protein n=1 Tax=Solirubrobacter deserti TaxID=2282478 RepID=A0ABT4RQB6_9ACTN|nr:hypothetical protein [Solirubrobacter deserti]MBE2320469.1 hypothetical protein [Solirubrobacter deserti]MDA0140716.1 hypothetical protein [Solirubrobacter deserti]
MILGRTYGPVGDWWFEAREFAEPRGAASLRELLGRCELVARVFADAELLRPETLTFSGWLTGPRESSRHIAHSDLVVPLAGNARGLAARGIVPVESLAQKLGEFAYPLTIEVAGTGIVLDARGERSAESDVAWLEGLTMGHHVVSVRVQSDAFLPFSVTGTPQHEIWEHNAPRLEAALRETSALLGVEPSADFTDHAIIDGFTLRNRTDVDGDVVPSFDG